MVKLYLKVYASAALCACAFLLFVFITSKSKASANEPAYYLDYVEPDHVVVVGAHYFEGNNTVSLTNGLREIGKKYKIIHVETMTAVAYTTSNPTTALIVFIAPKDSK